MASIVFYFQVHQPFRLRRYSVFDSDPFYFDDAKNAQICRKVADKCYRPATSRILDLVRRHKGNVKVAYSITGVALDQMQRWTPDVIDLFKALGDTGCCEFLGETYYHSLSFLYSRREFVEQVDMHTRLIETLFAQTPRVFRNTELIYANQLSQALSEMKDAKGQPRWAGCVCEGVDRHLGFRKPTYLYAPPPMAPTVGGTPRPLLGPGGRPFGLLLKNYRLSDDIAFRFSNRAWAEWPLSAEKFAAWANDINGDGYLCTLFMDYETFGEHQWADTGIFDFLDALPEKFFDINPGHNHFNTPSEALARFEPVGIYDVHDWISWADLERDLSAWRENAMQTNALDECYRLERDVRQRIDEARRSGDPEQIAHAGYLLEDWRKLTTSDHFYYMCTKYWSDGDVHKYFSPYDSPYDSYINYMNVLDNVRQRAIAGAAV